MGAKRAFEEMKEGRGDHKAEPHTKVVQRILPYHVM